MKYSSKISIGTAQFGLDYGITNNKGRILFPEVLKILKIAQDNNISKIDTARSYGVAEETLGKAVVQESFKIPKIGFIAGSKVLEGNIVRNGKARVIRDDEEIANGEITSLKHLKDDAKEIKEGFECGIGINDFSKFKEGDFIICYEIKSLKRKLKLN